MNDIHKHLPHSADSGADNSGSDETPRPHSLRDRWEIVRYGPVGRFLAYGLAFTATFVLISLFLWFLELGHF